MGNVTQAIKKRLSMGIVRRNEIIRLIERGINTAYSIAKAMDLDPGTVKHHLDWLEDKGLIKSTVVVEKGRAKKVFRLTFPVEVLERVMGILDLINVDTKEAEREIARLVLEVCEKLENGEMDFDDADRIFTALLAVKTVELSEEVEEMLTLANELHDGNWETVAILKSITKTKHEGY